MYKFSKKGNKIRGEFVSPTRICTPTVAIFPTADFTCLGISLRGQTHTFARAHALIREIRELYTSPSCLSAPRGFFSPEERESSATTL